LPSVSPAFSALSAWTTLSSPIPTKSSFLIAVMLRCRTLPCLSVFTTCCARTPLPQTENFELELFVFDEDVVTSGCVVVSVVTAAWKDVSFVTIGDFIELVAVGSFCGAVSETTTVLFDDAAVEGIDDNGAIVDVVVVEWEGSSTS
jgi:hypothetical protein